MSILAPIGAMVIQMAISRSREYLADATGARLAGSSQGLASALEKLGAYAKRLPMDASPQTAHMFIVNPLSGRSMMNLFSTHPPMEERIARLRGVRPPTAPSPPAPPSPPGNGRKGSSDRAGPSGIRCGAEPAAANPRAEVNRKHQGRPGHEAPTEIRHGLGATFSETSGYL
jgi:hypothetical protein